MKVSGRTKVALILGDPIGQVRAPELLNGTFAQKGIDAILVPLHVRAADLDRAVCFVRGAENVVGAIVTMPHKRAVVALLDSIEPEAQACHSCNVLVRRAGKLTGTMLDGEAMLRSLSESGHPVRDKRVHMLGAGGVAAGIANALGSHGARSLHISNRTHTNAEHLAGRLRKDFPAMVVTAGQGAQPNTDILINASSVGMRSTELPCPVAWLEGCCVVADVVVDPEWSHLLLAARARGIDVVSGVQMLRAQVELFIAYWGL